MTDTSAQNNALLPGQTGIIVEPNGQVRVILPEGVTGVSELHMAMIQACVRCSVDPEFAGEQLTAARERQKKAN